MSVDFYILPQSGRKRLTSEQDWPFFELLHIHKGIFAGQKAKIWPVKVGGGALARDVGLWRWIFGQEQLNLPTGAQIWFTRPMLAWKNKPTKLILAYQANSQQDHQAKIQLLILGLAWLAQQSLDLAWQTDSPLIFNGLIFSIFETCPNFFRSLPVLDSGQNGQFYL